MGSFLDKPKTDKTTESGIDDSNGLSFGLSAMQGWRIEMEDSHTSILKIPKLGMENWSFFAVFDGHAGGTVSKTSSQELLTCILNADPGLFEELASIYNNSKDAEQKKYLTESNISNTNLEQTQPGENDTKVLEGDQSSSPTEKCKLSEKSEPTDTSPSRASEVTENCVAEDTTSLSEISIPEKYTVQLENRLKKAIQKGFLDMDLKIRQMPEFECGGDKSGSTAVACLISPSHVYLINCGDSRALFVSNNKVALSTYDHKPINPIERERIQNAGGSVMIQRVNGSLAVSRALGDFEYKSVEGKGPCEQLVSPEPEIYCAERSPKLDEFIVLACDGIWDVISNEDLKDFIHSRLKVTNDLVKICNEVIDMCLNKGSRDNMSIVIVSFPGSPKIVQEEVDRENKCNEKIENRIKELIEKSVSKIEFSHVLNTISEEKWTDFPPGGGLHSKISLIEEIFNRLSPKSSDDSISNGYLLNSPL